MDKLAFESEENDKSAYKMESKNGRTLVKNISIRYKAPNLENLNHMVDVESVIVLEKK